LPAPSNALPISVIAASRLPAAYSRTRAYAMGSRNEVRRLGERHQRRDPANIHFFASGKNSCSPPML